MKEVARGSCITIHDETVIDPFFRQMSVFCGNVCEYHNEGLAKLLAVADKSTQAQARKDRP